MNIDSQYSPEVRELAQRWARHNLGDEWNRRNQDGEILPPVIWTSGGWEEVDPLSEMEMRELFYCVREEVNRVGVRAVEDASRIFEMDIEYAKLLCAAARIQ